MAVVISGSDVFPSRGCCDGRECVKVGGLQKVSEREGRIICRSLSASQRDIYVTGCIVAVHNEDGGGWRSRGRRRGGSTSNLCSRVASNLCGRVLDLVLGREVVNNIAWCLHVVE